MTHPPRATVIGSLPGTDPGAAARLVFAELPDLPHLAELPARGVGADMIGRGTGLLVDLYAEVQPSGWRLADRPGRDARRAVSYLRQDLDVLEENSQEFQGDLKVQAVGPWTLAATVELHHGDRMLADPGATRELAESLAEGLKLHLAEVRRRVPGARVLLQLDEPALPGVLRGTVPTASGFGRLRSVEEAVAREALARFIQTLTSAAPEDRPLDVAVHCCAPDVPFDLLRKAGASAISFDAAGAVPITAAGPELDEQLGQAIEAGVTLMLGLVPTAEPARPPAVTDLLRQITSLTRLGFPVADLAGHVAVTPTCGLAAASPPWARQALILAHRTADALADAAS